jgi:hypothetical protein
MPKKISWPHCAAVVDAASAPDIVQCNADFVEAQIRHAVVMANLRQPISCMFSVNYGACMVVAIGNLS